MSFSTVAFAGQTAREVTIEQRAKGSDYVVHGKVRKKKAERYRSAHGDDLIVTRVSLDVQEKFKGEGASQVEMIEEGGTLDGITLRVSDQPELDVGEEVVAFLKKTDEGYRPHMRGFGILRLQDGTGQVRESSLNLDTIREKSRNAH
jgi:hypothetical protein